MILARHGQSQFNVHFGATRTDPGIVDPILTELGRAQALAIADALMAGDRPRVKRLIASPYRRALETAEIVATRLDVPVSVEPLVRERAAFTCDIGSDPAELARRWPHLAFDHIGNRWWGAGEESETDLAARCRAFRAAMAAREDWREVAVVSHWGFIRALTGQPLPNGAWIAFDPTL
ncbi:MAG TPA: histidine phosphatase family protein [Alphaproteobacteria bacterium]|nr:histidine phosphatase family protein [Alphaproteobacteria bacterium]